MRSGIPLGTAKRERETEGNHARAPLGTDKGACGLDKGLSRMCAAVAEQRRIAVGRTGVRRQCLRHWRIAVGDCRMY